MPYAVRKVDGGYKATNKETGATYSKHPQSREMAARQIRAIHASQFREGSAHK